MINIGVLGCGAMGAGIAQVAVLNNCTVFVYDINTDALVKAKQNLNNALSRLLEKNKISRQQQEFAHNNITFTSSLKDLSNCFLVIEAVVENIEIKKHLFNELQKVVSPDCIIATNTSSIAIHAMAKTIQYPERFLGIHFFNPAFIMPLVEIIPTLLTSKNTIDKSLQIIQSWGKTTVVAKDTPGFIVNRIARPYYGEALRILDENIADIYTIDWVMKNIGGFKMGPFELMDLIGHDVNYIVTETVWSQMYYDSKFKPSITQKRLLEAGLLGKKTNRGFYDYSQPLPTEPTIKDKNLHQIIFERILFMLINEAFDALYYGIASKNDIEIAMQKGVNYPKGLLQWAEEIGVQRVYLQLQSYYNLYQEERYRPSILLKKINEAQ